MVIADDFVWAHLPKTGGNSTSEMFHLVGAADGIDDLRSPSKHESFEQRQANSGADLTVNRKRIMNIRRLPHWLLSRAQHIETFYGHPIDREVLRAGQIQPVCGLTRWTQRVADALARRIIRRDHRRMERLRGKILGWLTTMGATVSADDGLKSMMCGRVDYWIRQESLVDDFLEVVRHFIDVRAEDERAVRNLPRRNTAHRETNIDDWFTQDDLRRVYEANPFWAKIERELYGNTLDDQNIAAFNAPVGHRTDESQPSGRQGVEAVANALSSSPISRADANR
jgi:hypothetical protein